MTDNTTENHDKEVIKGGSFLKKNTTAESEFEKVIEKKFFCPSKFAQEIELIVKENDDVNYIDAIIIFCERNNIDLESVPKLISKPLKEKIKCDAIELNFLKRTSRAKLVF